MDKFVSGVLIKVLSDPAVQLAIKNILGELITERIVPLIPLAVASATKAVTEALPDIATASIDHVAETITNDLSHLIPGLDLGDIMDFWKTR